MKPLRLYFLTIGLISLSLPMSAVADTIHQKVPVAGGKEWNMTVRSKTISPRMAAQYRQRFRREIRKEGRTVSRAHLQKRARPFR